MQIIMFKCSYVILLLCLFHTIVNGQTFSFSPQLSYDSDLTNIDLIKNNIEQLFDQISNEEISDDIIYETNRDLTKHIFLGYGIFDSEQMNAGQQSYIEVINLYKLEENVFSFDVSVMESDSFTKAPSLQNLINIIAYVYDDKVEFTLPLHQHTRQWKTQQVGSIKYHYPHVLNLERANEFDRKNKLIASRFGIEHEEIDFYMCSNFQDILAILGVKYDAFENGKYADGYGVVSNHIFSIQNNEDFSHDIFHFYSGKLHQRSNRNWIAEEGIAYSWGNAYYADKNGEMINQDVLIQELLNYHADHPNESLYGIFKTNKKIYNHISPYISVRSLISSVICDEIYEELQMNGILKIINAGRVPSHHESFMAQIEGLLELTEDNFDSRVLTLLGRYK